MASLREHNVSNLTFDLTPPEDLLNENVIIGGELQDFVYKDCQKEMDMINRTFCEIMIEGDAKGHPFAYPINGSRFIQ